MKISSYNNKLRVAFCGTRGLPANYGGFETAVDEITKNLINKGIECSVFCRTDNILKETEDFEGRKLIFVTGSNHRKLDTFVSSIKTGLYLIRHRKSFDYILWFNNANMLGIILSIFSGIPLAVNTDGLEWRRAKWSWPFKTYYFLSTLIISLFCRNLISDSISIQNYYKKVFKRRTHFIPYGAPEIKSFDDTKKKEVLEKYGLQENKYFLQITRFEPDNLPLDIIKGFKKSGLYNKGFKHVLIGYKDETSYSTEIMEYNMKNGIVVLPANYNFEELAILRQSSFAYLHGNSVGGTNPALLEAMGYCKRIIAIDGPFSREVLGNHGLFFSIDNLPMLLNEALRLDDQSQAMSKRLLNKYQWEAVSNCYLELINSQPANYTDNLDIIEFNSNELPYSKIYN